MNLGIFDPRIRVGDVIVRTRRPPMRLTVEGWTARGKLLMRRPHGTTLTTWWHQRADLPAGYHLERDGVRIH